MNLDNESLYFAKQEFERKQQIVKEKQKKLDADDKKKLKELHFMKCPKCGSPLIEVDFKSTKVDRCSACSGIWMDKDEINLVLDDPDSTIDRFFSVFSKKKP